MTSNQEIKKTLKVVIICVVIFLVLLFVYHFFINSLGNPEVKKETPVSYSIEEINENYQNPEYCAGGYFIVENNEDQNLKTLILTDDLKTIETINLPQSNVYCLYDNYYLIQNSSNLFTLKRNGSIIKANIALTDNLNEIYNDATSKNAKYIAKAYLEAVVNKQNHFLVEEKVALANNLLIDINNGQIIDDKIVNAYKINIANEEKINYLYVEGATNYIYNLNSKQKILENKKIIFNNQVANDVYNSSGNNIVFSDANGWGIANFLGNIILESSSQEIKIESNNSSYFAVKRNDKYGLINNFGSLVWDFNYDKIIILDEFIIAITNHQLSIYDLLLNKLNEEYALFSNDITINQYAQFYQIKNEGNSSYQEIILLKDGTSHIIQGLTPILYGEYFYGNPCYLVNNEGRFYVYVNQETKYPINTEFTNNVDHAIMLNDNRLYLDFAKQNKIQYGYYRINSGSALGAYLKDKVDVEMEVIHNNDLVFSRENNLISVYYQNVLKDEITAQKIISLKDDYYLLKTEEKDRLVRISLKK